MAIVSVLGLSGVLSSLLGPDVIIDTSPKPGGWLLVSARSSVPDESLEIWLLDYGAFTEAMLNFKTSPRLPKIVGARQASQRLADFCGQLEIALSSDADALDRKAKPAGRETAWVRARRACVRALLGRRMDRAS